MRPCRAPRMHCHVLPPGGVYRDLPDSMPKYQSSKWRSQKDVDRLNEARSGTMLDSSRISRTTFRPTSTTTKRF